VKKCLASLRSNFVSILPEKTRESFLQQNNFSRKKSILFEIFFAEQILTTRVARLFLVQHTKTGKIYQIIIIYPEEPQNIPNGCKIDQMVINIPTSSIARPSKIDSNWDFWFKNMPSGNPAQSITDTKTFAGIRFKECGHKFLIFVD
jgi:hypothetical protein